MTTGSAAARLECWADKAEPLRSINCALNKALEALVLLPGKHGKRLKRLAQSRAQTPLYSFAHTEPYPLLKEEFVGFVAKKMESATQRKFNQVIALQVLEAVGHQPAPFLNAVANAMSQPGWTVAHGLRAMLNPKMTNKWSSAWHGLTDLQRFALRVAHEGLQLTSAQSLSRAAQELSQPKVQPSSLTRAMNILIDNGLGGTRARIAAPSDKRPGDDFMAEQQPKASRAGGLIR